MITLTDNTLVVIGGSAIGNGIWGNPSNRSNKKLPTKTGEHNESSSVINSWHRDWSGISVTGTPGSFNCTNTALLLNVKSP